MNQREYEKRLQELALKQKFGVIVSNSNDVGHRHMKVFKEMLVCELAIPGIKDHYFMAEMTMSSMDRFCIKIKKEKKQQQHSFTHLFRKPEDDQITNLLNYFKKGQLLEMKYKIDNEKYMFLTKVFKVHIGKGACDLELHLCSMEFPLAQIQVWEEYFKKNTEDQKTILMDS